MTKAKTTLVIVESPTKAKTISQILGQDYTVEASMGHLRDLPKAKLGVDTDHNFEPEYVVPTTSRKTVTKLKKLFASATDLILATDEDREGEAIAWHITQALDIPSADLKRIVFHEITKEAVEAAIASPRHIDSNLVGAQQARRVLDRLVGYKLSPLLWKKLFRGLSAGRVQSVAVKLIVDKEREIQAFKPEEYYKVLVQYATGQTGFEAELTKLDDKKFAVTDKAEIEKIVGELKADKSVISDLTKSERKRSPSPPFTTSTLQQQAGTWLGYSVKKTMTVAQQLYETGLITYMRTDSTNLAAKVIGEIRDLVGRDYGAEYVPDKPIFYKTKSKGAQEAHEAIRPSVVAKTPESLKAKLTPDQAKLYQLIWERAVACQMTDAIIDQLKVVITSTNKTLEAQGVAIKFPGFTRVMTRSATKEVKLPSLKVAQELKVADVSAEQKFTEPPARYSEPTLVKALEKLGIGRPSTYAPTITTIITRGYIKKEQKQLVPQETGFLVNDFLVEHFPKIVDEKFTANMEDDLDKIAEGERVWHEVVAEFYGPFAAELKEKEKTVSKRADETTEEKCDKCGKPMVIKMGRFGKFLACSGFPECKNAKPIDGEGPEETEEKCEKCGKPMLKRRGRFGEFLGCSGYPECKTIKNIENPNAIDCPKCGEGKVSSRRTKRGRVFWGCSKYPKCDFASWQEPVAEKCPSCGGVMVKKGGKAAIPTCMECGYEDKSIKS